jgi:MerR family mercuric resistance operon transcriptional regulator
MAGRMTISQLAKAAGVGVETVRYYQRRGLLPVPRTFAGSYRDYDLATVKRLRLIRGLKSAGFTLNEIGELISLDRGTKRLAIQAIASRKLAELNGKMREMRKVSNGLKALLSECQSAQQGTPCPIIEAFDI